MGETFREEREGKRTERGGRGRQTVRHTYRQTERQRQERIAICAYRTDCLCHYFVVWMPFLWFWWDPVDFSPAVLSGDINKILGYVLTVLSEYLLTDLLAIYVTVCLSVCMVDLKAFKWRHSFKRVLMFKCPAPTREPCAFVCVCYVCCVSFCVCMCVCVKSPFNG